MPANLKPWMFRIVPNTYLSALLQRLIHESSHRSNILCRLIVSFTSISPTGFEGGSVQEIGQLTLSGRSVQFQYLQSGCTANSEDLLTFGPREGADCGLGDILRGLEGEVEEVHPGSESTRATKSRLRRG